MNYYYKDLNNYNDINWLNFYTLLGKLSKSIRSKNTEQIKNNLLYSIHDVLCFAKQNDIDMHSSWYRWQNKMDYKHYT